MDAYCPHLGANLALGGRVEGCNLVCPFHWWEWDGEGRNARIPYSDRTNAKARVRSYPTIDVNGFVMFWYHPDPQPGAAVGDPGASRVRNRRMDRPDRRGLERAVPVAGARRERPRLRAPEDRARRGDRARDREHHVRRLVQPPSRPRRLRDAARPAARPHRHRQLGTGLRPSPASAGSSTRCSSRTTTPIDWEWTQSIKVYKVKKLGTDADALEKTRRVGEALVRDLQQADGRGQRDLRQQDPHREPGARRRRRSDPPVPQMGRPVLRFRPSLVTRSDWR